MDIRSTEAFDTWMSELSDEIGRGKIIARIERMRINHFGDHKAVGEGVSELRVGGTGPGYRVYYTRRGERIVILLCGGEKSSQASDIKQAKALAAALP